jgi:hypothetical protein
MKKSKAKQSKAKKRKAKKGKEKSEWCEELNDFISGLTV